MHFKVYIALLLILKINIYKSINVLQNSSLLEYSYLKHKKNTCNENVMT